MMNIEEKMIENIVRRILEEKIKDNSMEKHIDTSGVISIKIDSVKAEKFHTGKDGDKVYLKDILTTQESPRLGCGIMEMDETTFDWTLKYDEIDYIIDGTLEIIIDGNRVVGNKGDIIYIPKDSSIQFSVKDYAKFMYVTYPANWEDQ